MKGQGIIMQDSRRDGQVLVLVGILLLLGILVGGCGKSSAGGQNAGTSGRAMILQPLNGVVPKDPFYILGKTTKDLLSDLPGGKAMMGTSAEGTSLSGYEYKQHWFGLAEPLKTSYLVDSGI